MTIHVIHEIRRIDRWQTLQHEIEKHHLTVNYWPAIMDSMISFRGVARAHKSIVRWAKENNLPEVLIAEDDFKLLGKGAFEYYLNNKPADYDLYLGGIFGGEIKDNIVPDFAGLSFYMVHSRFYDAFLAANEMNNFDRSLANLGKYVVCNPIIVSQYGGYSDNKKEYVADYDHLLKQYNTYND